jgi:hypothetical protein
VTSEAKYYTLNVAIHRVVETYQVELSHSDPDSQAKVAPVRRTVAFDTAALRQLEAMHVDYGKALAAQLFAEPDLLQRFIQVETAAQASNSFVRVLLCIDPSAQELQRLRWELLRHPQSGALLSSSETVLISRFMISRDWRPVKLRAYHELTALIAISAPLPGKLERMGLAPVDYDRELEGVRQILQDIEVRTLGGPNSPFTLERLADELQSGIDILYIVSHGMIGRGNGLPVLILQDDAGEPKPTLGEDLAVRIAELQKVPRLTVLAACQSAGVGSQSATVPHSTLAEQLADAGVPAVIAMQGYITMQTISAMMPTFFTELLRDGQIDRALSVARGKVRDRDDAWMPALYTRLTAGRLWYTPGFRDANQQKSAEIWKRLLTPVSKGKVVPILGPRLLDSAYGDSHQTAMRLARANHYPLARHEWDDLSRVTEYVSIKESRFNVTQAYQKQLLDDLIKQHKSWLPPEEIPPANKRPKLGKILALVGDHLREDKDDPHRILSELSASVYVTINFDTLLERALRAQGREPQHVITRWRCEQEARGEAPIVEPTGKTPLVYHMLGAFGTKNDESLVLTADDHIDFLIQTVAGKLLPTEVERALCDNSLLFLGFRLTDWNFRVLFRLLMSLEGREQLKQYCHVAVQLDPDLHSMIDVFGAKEYLTKYFGKNASIDIFWGSSEEFLCALRDAMATAEVSVDETPQEDDDDEWEF